MHTILFSLVNLVAYRRIQDSRHPMTMEESALNRSDKVIVQCLKHDDDILITEVITLSALGTYNSSLKKAEIKSLLCDGLINILVARLDNENKVLGFILFYSHYSTWVGESTVIKHLVTFQQNKSIAKQLVNEAFNFCQRLGISRFDVFTDDKWLKQVLQDLQFENLSHREEWDCYSLCF